MGRLARLQCNADKDCGPPGKSQFPASPVATVVTTNFEKREPTVTDMLRKLSFTNKQMGAVLAWRDANRPSADEAAVYFLENYKEVWPAWLNDAARKKLAPLMK